jgi:hypothetical protein
MSVSGGKADVDPLLLSSGAWSFLGNEWPLAAFCNHGQELIRDLDSEGLNYAGAAFIALK